MRTLIKFFLITLLISACGKAPEKKRVPKDIVQSDKLPSLLADIYMVDGAANVKRFGENGLIIDAAGFYEKEFKKHGVTKAEFENTLRYYSRHPKELDEIYTEAINILSERLAKEKAAIKK
jgi:hypothetical protein